MLIISILNIKSDQKIEKTETNKKKIIEAQAVIQKIQHSECNLECNIHWKNQDRVKNRTLQLQARLRYI